MSLDTRYLSSKVILKYLSNHHYSALTHLTLVSTICLTVFAPITYAALSATTANVIEGSEPYFLLVANGVKITNTNELLGFSYPDVNATDGIKQISYSGATELITIPANVKLNEIMPLFTPTATNTYQSLNALLGTDFTVGDDDGDAFLSNNISALGDMKIQLLEDGTAIIPSNAYLKPCSSYQLKIDIKTGTGANTVTAKTAYGYPDKREYTGSTSATYNLLSANAKICYIQTHNMKVYNNFTAADSRFPYVDATNTGGYNPAFWDYDSVSNTHKGFNVTKIQAASSVKKFPTTGFKNAQLTFLGSGDDQSLYQCDISVSAGGSLWASKGGSNGCTLTYTSSGRPTGDLTVTLKTNPTPPATAKVLDTYTIYEPAKWAEAGDPNLVIVDGTKPYTNHKIPFNQNSNFSQRYLAAESCGGFDSSLIGPANHAAASEKFFSLKEITNAPQVNTNYYIYNGTSWVLSRPSDPKPVTGGRFSRDVDGTFMGEWGNVQNYINSAWELSNVYWTSEAYSSNLQYRINTGGNVDNSDPSTGFFSVLCKR